MRIPRLPARPWVAVAAVVAAAAILLTVIHQGNANANTAAARNTRITPWPT